MRAPGEVQALFAGESHLDAIARDARRGPARVPAAQRRPRRGGRSRSATGSVRRGPIAVLEAVRAALDWDAPRCPAHHGRGVALGVRHVGGGALGLRRSGSTRIGRVEVRTGLADQGGGQCDRDSAGPRRGDRPSTRIESRSSTGRRPMRRPTRGRRNSRHAHRQPRRRDARRAAPRVDRRATARARCRTAPSDARCSATTRSSTPRPARSCSRSRSWRGRLVAPDQPLLLDATYDRRKPRARTSRATTTSRRVASRSPSTPRPAPSRSTTRCWSPTSAPIVNPVGHAGQLDGGFAFGVGAALMEELVVEDGVMVGRSLGEIRLPASRDVPAAPSCSSQPRSAPVRSVPREPAS